MNSKLNLAEPYHLIYILQRYCGISQFVSRIPRDIMYNVGVISVILFSVFVSLTHSKFVCLCFVFVFIVNLHNITNIRCVENNIYLQSAFYYIKEKYKLH